VEPASAANAARTTPRETILAVASPPGRGVRAIVRASGPAVRAMVERVLLEDGRADGMRAAERRPILAARGVRPLRARTRLGEVPVIASWLPGPATFTGEDALELSCVAAPALVHALEDALLSAAEASGASGASGVSCARRARPGEFAFRAHLAGRLSIEGAEAIAARIAATADAELVAADAVADGTYGRRAAELVARNAELLALVEAGIDFTDQEDVVAIEAAELARRTALVADDVRALRGGGASMAADPQALVVLAGAPNAGKSSLFNALLGRTRTVVSATAGSTRDAIRERLRLGLGLEADLVDLAGLDAEACLGGGASSAASGIADAMQRRAREFLTRADLVVRCTPHGEAPVALPAGVSASRVVDVATKCDAASNDDASSTLATSARTGRGIERLRARLAEAVRNDHALREARLATVLPRHDASLATAALLLADAAGHAASDARRGRTLRDPELVASLLRAALDALGEIAGPVHPDDVLGLVFSRFCIGK
jgi:tRNA modification GTPase